MSSSIEHEESCKQQQENKNEAKEVCDSKQTQYHEANKTTQTSNFIKTANRRHIDFDPEYDLSDKNATGRSRWQKPWFFIQAADTQFGMIDSYIRKKTEPGWLEEIQLSTSLVQAINTMPERPKFMVVCGDLVDAMPDSQELKQMQIADFKQIFSKLSIPLVCVCGNHDVGNEPTPESIGNFKRDFGDDYFYFTTNDVLFIVINSQFYQNRDFVEQYAKDQDEWLEKMLKLCKSFKYSIIFEHIPWFLQNPDEEDEYFNIRKEIRLSWLDKFKQSGVTKIMCGHYHRNAGGWYHDMELVVTSAIGAQCGDDKSGARFVKLLDDSIEHKYFSIEEIVDFSKENRQWLRKDLYPD